MKDATKKATITITPGPGALDAATAKANDGDIIEIVCDEGKFWGRFRVARIPTEGNVATACDEFGRHFGN
jgi:hypothetical protein